MSCTVYKMSRACYPRFAVEASPENAYTYFKYNHLVQYVSDRLISRNALILAPIPFKK